MKQSWLTFALTKSNYTFICLWQVNYLSTITKLLDNYLILLQNYQIFDNYYKIISDTVVLKIVAREFLSSII